MKRALILTLSVSLGASASLAHAQSVLYVDPAATGLNESKLRNLTGTTDIDGEVIFKLSNAPSGLYTAAVTNVTVTGLTWDGTTGQRSYDKPLTRYLPGSPDLVIAVRSRRAR